MTYPPQGASGWPGGDPHEAPTQLAAGFQPQPPHPPQPHPPPPYGGPAPYGAPPPYGAVPPKKKPKKNKTGLVIGIVAGAAVLLLCVGVVGVAVLASLAGDEDDPPAPPSGIEFPTNAPAVPGGDAPAPPPAGGEPAPGTGSHGYVEDLCQQADFSPVFSILPAEDGPDEWAGSQLDAGSVSFASCSIDLSDGSSFGYLSVSVSTDRDHARARRTYEASLGGLAFTPDSSRAAPGPWQEGTLELGDGFSDASATIHVLDGNLAMSVGAFFYGSAGTEADLAEAVQAVAGGILQLTAR